MEINDEDEKYCVEFVGAEDIKDIMLVEEKPST